MLLGVSGARDSPQMNPEVNDCQYRPISSSLFTIPRITNLHCTKKPEALVYIHKRNHRLRLAIYLG